MSSRTLVGSWNRAVLAGAAMAFAACVELDLTRVPTPSAAAPASDATATSGYLCVVVTPSPARSLFAPEWKRMTVALLSPASKRSTKATIDFAGFSKEGTPAAFPCVPFEESEPTVIAFDVEGNHGAVEQAARQTLSSITDTLANDVLPIKTVSQSTARAANGLDGVVLSDGVATAVIGSPSWCARRPHACFATLGSTGALSATLVVGPRGTAARVKDGRVVDANGATIQGVAVALALEPMPRPDALPAECLAELDSPDLTHFTACASAATGAALTRADARALRELLSALTLAGSDALQPAMRAAALQDVRATACRGGRFAPACARAATVERELLDLREGEEAEASIRGMASCDAAAMAPSVLAAADARLARNARAMSVARQGKALAALVRERRVACFRERLIATCGPDCPHGWLAKATGPSGPRLVLGYDAAGCRGNALASFAGAVRAAAAGLSDAEDVRATLAAVTAPEQATITQRWCTEVARLADVLRTSGLFRELEAADTALRRQPAAEVDIDGDLPERYAYLRGLAPADRVAALLNDGDALRGRLPALFGSAEDGAPALRDGAQDRLEADVHTHIRLVRDAVAKVAVPGPHGT